MRKSTKRWTTILCKLLLKIPGLNTGNISSIRIGKPNPSHPYLLKITLQSPIDVSLVVKNTKVLPKSISISSDLKKSKQAQKPSLLNMAYQHQKAQRTS